MSTSLAAKKVTFKSFDNKIFKVEVSVAAKSVVIQPLIVYGCPVDIIPLPNVSGKILSLVLQYCRHVDSEGEDWLTQFLQVDMDTLFYLIQAADYLNIPDLLNVTRKKVVAEMKGKRVEEIRETFKLKNDLSEREENQIRGEQEWLIPGTRVSPPLTHPVVSHVCIGQVRVPRDKDKKEDAKSLILDVSNPRVLLLQNMVYRGEVDDELKNNVASYLEEKCGRITGLLVVESKERKIRKQDAVCIYVQFKTPEQAKEALKSVQTRVYAQFYAETRRKLKAALYDVGKFGKIDFPPYPGPFDALPNRVVISILSELSRSATCSADFFSVIHSCHRLRTLGLRKEVLSIASPGIFGSADIDWSGDIAEGFLNMCKEYGNPTARSIAVAEKMVFKVEEELEILEDRFHEILRMFSS